MSELVPAIVARPADGYGVAGISIERSVFTVMAAGETLGIPIASVRTIFRASGITPIPLAPQEILGLVNLRGKIVTALSLRRRLGLPPDVSTVNALSVGIEHRGEDFALVVDAVREVVPLPEGRQIPVPSNIHAARAGFVREVYQLESTILTVLDLDALFDFVHVHQLAAAE